MTSIEITGSVKPLWEIVYDVSNFSNICTVFLEFSGNRWNIY